MGGNISKMKTLKNLIFIMLIVSMVSPVTFATTVHEVASQLICTCGCDNMIVSDCNCGAADDVRAAIQSKIDNGMDKAAILSDFASQYGEKVLAAPTKSGFNLTAWTMPFIVLLVAAVAVTYVIRRWVRASQKSARPAVPVHPQHYAQDLERLKRELDGFDT